MEERDGLDLHSTLGFPNLRDLPHSAFLFVGSSLDTEVGPPSVMSWVLAELRGSSSQDSAAPYGPHLNVSNFRNQSLALEEREVLSSQVLEQEG